MACQNIETIFENRFMHVPELVRMGADIQVEGRIARSGASRHYCSRRSDNGFACASQSGLAALAAEGVQ